MSTPARLTVLAGPTAVGKGTVAAYIKANYPQVWLSGVGAPVGTAALSITNFSRL